MFLHIIFSYTQYTGGEPIRKEVMDLYMTKDTDEDEAYAAGENILRLAVTDEERAKAYAKWERLCMIKIVMQRLFSYWKRVIIMHR